MAKSSNKYGHVAAAVLFAALLFGYYKDDADLTINRLSSDQWNIVPVMQKIQDTTLFAHDLYAGNLAGIKQYIPAFVQTGLYFSKFTNGNAIDGQRWFHLATFLIFFLLWYVLFFYLTKNSWYSLLLVLIARGILWPPGNEIWGIGDIIFFLPRTVFSSLVPVPFLCFALALQQQKNHWYYIGFLALGLISNYHPISGVGVAFGALVALFCFTKFIVKTSWVKAFSVSVLSGLLFLAGLYFFIQIYFTSEVSQKPPDPALFRSLLSERISGFFLNPISLYQGYNSVQWYIMIGMPILMSVIFFRKFSVPHQRIVKFTWIYIVGITTTPLVFFYVEAGLAALNIAQLTMAFQLVRNSKYLLIGLYILLAISGWHLFSRYPTVKKISTPAIALGLFLMVSFLGKSYPNVFPMFRFDFFRGQLPDAFTSKPYLPRKYDHLDTALAWIKINTPKDAVFAGETQLRAGALRSVAFDYKGASMLIEEDKIKYMAWANNNKIYEKLKTSQERINFFKQLGVEYLLTSQDSTANEALIKTFYEWKLYKLKPLEK